MCESIRLGDTVEFVEEWVESCDHLEVMTHVGREHAGDDDLARVEPLGSREAGEDVALRHRENAEGLSDVIVLEHRRVVVEHGEVRRGCDLIVVRLADDDRTRLTSDVAVGTTDSTLGHDQMVRMIDGDTPDATRVLRLTHVTRAHHARPTRARVSLIVAGVGEGENPASTSLALARVRAHHAHRIAGVQQHHLQLVAEA